MNGPFIDILKIIIRIVLGSNQKNSKDQNLFVEEIMKYYHENVEYKHFMVYIPSNWQSHNGLIVLGKFYHGNYLYYLFEGKRFFFYNNC